MKYSDVYWRMMERHRKDEGKSNDAMNNLLGTQMKSKDVEEAYYTVLNALMRCSFDED